MIVLRGVVLAVRFACELGMLAALTAAGFALGQGTLGWALGLGAPVLAGAVWGMFVAPKAMRPVPVPVRLAIELTLFGVATAGLAYAGRPGLALVLGAASLVTSLGNAATAPPPASGRG